MKDILELKLVISQMSAVKYFVLFKTYARTHGRKAKAVRKRDGFVLVHFKATF